MKRTKFPSESNLLESQQIEMLPLEQIEILIIESTKSTGFLTLNKSLIKLLGLVDASFLSLLVNKHNYWKERGTKENETYDGWFYHTHKNIMEELGISDHQIRESKKRLIQDGLIITKKMKTPAKEFYQIDFEILYRGLVLEKVKDLSSKNQRTYNKNKINNIKYNNKNIQKRFSKPSIGEIKEYCQERNNKINPEVFFDYYESKGWVIGKTPMKNWKAAVRTWEKNNFSDSNNKHKPGNTTNTYKRKKTNYGTDREEE